MSNVHHLNDADFDEVAEAIARADELPAPAQSAGNVLWADTPLGAQWARFRDAFASAMEGGLYTVEDLELMIQTGEGYFWPGVTSAVVAKRVVYPSGEAVMQTLWAVGDIEEVVALEPGIAATGRLLGCSSMLVEGRAAWTKVLKSAGYEPWSVTLRKAL